MIEKIKAHFREECADMTAYIDLATEAKSSGHEHEFIIIRDIAREEHTHAKHLYHIIEDHGAMTDDCMKLWMDCDQKFHNYL